MKGGSYTSLKVEEIINGPTKPETWISIFRQSGFELEEAPDLDQVHLSGSSELTCSVTENRRTSISRSRRFQNST